MPLNGSPPRHQRFSDRFGPTTVTIGPDVVIHGELTGSANARFAGTLEGTLSVDGIVFVEPEARITGRIEAAAVVVQGRIEGEIHASGKVELCQTCHVEGDIVAGSVAIADGATFDGAITMRGSSATPADLTFTEKRNREG
jgi:cytoskeletal protein CcmA (bactofilin family)